MKKKFLKIKFLVLVACCLLLPFLAKASVLYLEPISGQYHAGDTFIVDLRIDTEKECINTVEANLKFPQEILQVIDFSRGQSIIPLWIKSPEINQDSGFISFSGGIPGGYCGIIPGDPGETNILGQIIFKVQESLRETKTAEIKFLDNSQVLLNDGFGTPAKLTTKGANFNILSGKTSPTRNEWEDKLVQDTILPNPFEIELHKNKAIFEGKYFIIFSTTDKQTGIDYYEVKEGEKNWKKATSPYLLEDQKLKSIIEVKAVDKAGNERISEYIPPKKPIYLWIIIIILFVLAGVFLFIKKYKKSK